MHQYVSFDLEPAELDEIGPAALVTKHPLVLPLFVQLAPVLGFAPGPGFLRMSMLGIAVFPLEHPLFQHLEGTAGNPCSEVVGPAPDEGIAPPDHGADVGTA